MTLSRPVEILLVEDNPGDARLTFEALRDGPFPSNLHHVIDGEQAMQYLRRQPPWTDAPAPDIVLLDLNLPRKNGREVLQEMRNDEALRAIPVVALTTSSAREDVNACYALGANAYMVKPVEFDRFVEAVRVFEDFWLKIVALPRT